MMTIIQRFYKTLLQLDGYIMKIHHSMKPYNSAPSFSMPEGMSTQVKHPNPPPAVAHILGVIAGIS